MTDKKEKYRNEWKYLIREKDRLFIEERLSVYLQKDKNVKGDGYYIRSLYFDDYYDSSYEEKDAGVLFRKKYRIRIYNYSDEQIKLERKKKIGAYIYKEDAPLTKEEVYKIIDGDYQFLLHSPYPLCQQFYYECMTNGMRPKVIVDYFRTPYTLEQGTVRITLDQQVCAAVGSYDIFDSTIPAFEVLEPDKLILEVKFTEFIPDLVKQLLPAEATEFTAVSKYTLCYEKAQEISGLSYLNM